MTQLSVFSKHLARRLLSSRRRSVTYTNADTVLNVFHLNEPIYQLVTPYLKQSVYLPTQLIRTHMSVDTRVLGDPVNARPSTIRQISPNQYAVYKDSYKLKSLLFEQFPPTTFPDFSDESRIAFNSTDSQLISYCDYDLAVNDYIKLTEATPTPQELSKIFKDRLTKAIASSVEYACIQADEGYHYNRCKTFYSNIDAIKATLMTQPVINSYEGQLETVRDFMFEFYQYSQQQLESDPLIDFKTIFEINMHSFELPDGSIYDIVEEFRKYIRENVDASFFGNDNPEGTTESAVSRALQLFDNRILPVLEEYMIIDSIPIFMAKAGQQFSDLAQQIKAAQPEKLSDRLLLVRLEPIMHNDEIVAYQFLINAFESNRLLQLLDSGAEESEYNQHQLNSLMMAEFGSQSDTTTELVI